MSSASDARSAEEELARLRDDLDAERAVTVLLEGDLVAALEREAAERARGDAWRDRCALLLRVVGAHGTGTRRA